MNDVRADIRFGTRGSALAMWQTHHVMSLLQAVHPSLMIDHHIISTRGDKIVDTPLPLIGGKGLFTEALEAALFLEEIDAAVHSLKDLPTEQPDGLTIGAVIARANPADVLISRAGFTLATLPEGARVGTCSRRRAAQLLAVRPDLTLLDLRGNVDTRIRKALDDDSPYDAIVLAFAGVERLGQLSTVSEVIDLDIILPAPGQGAIAVQTRLNDDLISLLSPLNHAATALAVTAERAFLAGLGGGCSIPVAALAETRGTQLMLHGRVSSLDGRHVIEVGGFTTSLDEKNAQQLGRSLADQALAEGAHLILEQSP